MGVLDSAVAYWRADQYSGSGDLLDLSGNGHDGQFGDGSTSSTFPVHAGDYFTMDGNQYFLVPNHADINFTDAEDFTLMARIGVTASTAIGNRVFEKRNANGYILFLVTFGTALGPQLFLDGATTGTSTTPAGIDTGLQLDPGDVAVITGRRDADGSPYVFIGGDSSNAGTDSTGTLEDSIGLYIGGNSSRFVGHFYSGAIFASALSDADVATAAAELAAPYGKLRLATLFAPLARW